ncbi:MAG: hypothetical protein PVG24_09695 [Gammaproteobacteria bacterium]
MRHLCSLQRPTMHTGSVRLIVVGSLLIVNPVVKSLVARIKPCAQSDTSRCDVA